MLGAETLDLIQLDVGVLRHRHGGTRDPPVGAVQPGGQIGSSSGLSMQPGVARMRNNFAARAQVRFGSRLGRPVVYFPCM